MFIHFQISLFYTDITKMQEMNYLQDNSKVEALTKAVLISILGVAIVLSNLLIIATYANFKGKINK